MVVKVIKVIKVENTTSKTFTTFTTFFYILSLISIKTKLLIMRKLLLLISGIIFFAACSGKRNNCTNSLCDKDINIKVDTLVAKMTLQEKLKMIGGFEGFYIMPVPRLGLPKIKMSDASVGVRNYGKSTAYPASILLAASWDTAMARTIGKSIGIEARGKGVNILLGPGLNIYRAPMCGRNFEYLGEDPYLTGHMASSFIQGVQSMKVVATAKHFAANNQEWDRHNVSSDIDERTLQEIYLPGFKAAVLNGKAGAVMNSYNLLNGIHTSQNYYLLTKILKENWKFNGIVMSDWGSTYDGLAAANAGLDLEMPSGVHMNSDSLMPAIESGKLKMSLIDDKIRRILRMYYKFGFMDSSWDISSKPVNKDQLSEVALEGARAGIVLLKNTGKILPLNKEKIKTIAVLGPNAELPVTGGGGSAYVNPYQAISVLDGIKQIAGNAIRVKFQSGMNESVSSEFYKNSVFLSSDSKTNVLKGEFFNNINLEGKPGFTREDKFINFNWDVPVASGFKTVNFSARWTGKIKVEKSGIYMIAVSGDDGYRLFIDNNKFIESWVDEPENRTIKIIKLVAGKEYQIKLEYYQHLGGGCIRFGYKLQDDNPVKEAIKVAKSADVAVVCVGFDFRTEGEGYDRSFGLPLSQVDLIKQISSVNKNTIVVLNSGGNADIAAWINDVPALMH